MELEKSKILPIAVLRPHDSQINPINFRSQYRLHKGDPYIPRIYDYNAIFRKIFGKHQGKKNLHILNIYDYFKFINALDYLEHGQINEINILKENECFKSIESVESGWRKIIVEDKISQTPIRELYISNNGVVFERQELVKDKSVPEELYFADIEYEVEDFEYIDSKYYSEEYQDFMNNYYATAIARVDEMIAAFGKDDYGLVTGQLIILKDIIKEKYEKEIANQQALKNQSNPN